MDLPFRPGLFDALEGSIRDGCEGLGWRQVVGTTDPSRTNVLGGRWNRGGVEVPYCTLGRRGAEMDLRACLDRQPLPVRHRRGTCRLSVGQCGVEAVAGPDFLNWFGTTCGDLVGSDCSTAQLPGCAADRLDIAGMMVPSARHDAGNLLMLGNRLATEVPEELPRGPRRSRGRWGRDKKSDMAQIRRPCPAPSADHAPGRGVT